MFLMHCFMNSFFEKEFLKVNENYTEWPDKIQYTTQSLDRTGNK